MKKGRTSDGRINPMISQSDFFLRSSATNRAEARSNVVTYCGDVHMAKFLYWGLLSSNHNNHMDLFDTRLPKSWWSIMVNHGESWSITMFIFDKKRRDPFRFVWKSPRNLLDYQLSSFSFIFPIQIAILGGRNPPFFSTGPMCPPPAMKGRSETAWRDATGRNRSDD